MVCFGRLPLTETQWLNHAEPLMKGLGMWDQDSGYFNSLYSLDYIIISIKSNHNGPLVHHDTQSDGMP